VMPPASDYTGLTAALLASVGIGDLPPVVALIQWTYRSCI
jgi:hypothetical protein